MIIDQLFPTASDNLTDEVPVEQGTSTFKTTWQKILNLFKANISASDISSTGGNVQTDIGNLQSDKLSIDGTSDCVWYSNTYDLNDFFSGVVLCGDMVQNIPYAEWVFVIAAGQANTVTQIAFPLGNNYVPMQRNCSAGTWSSWRPMGIDKKGTISLSSTWSGSGPYYQTVTVSGATVTANSKVDLQPDETQLATLINTGVTSLLIKNNNGTLTAYALGSSPPAMTVQCTVTEVIP